MAMLLFVVVTAADAIRASFCMRVGVVLILVLAIYLMKTTVTNLDKKSMTINLKSNQKVKKLERVNVSNFIKITFRQNS